MASMLFALIYTPGANWKPGRPVSEQGLGDHQDYIHDLHLAGVLFLAGPFPDASGAMAVVDVETKHDAEEILAADPAITQQLLQAMAYPWKLIDWEGYQRTR